MSENILKIDQVHKWFGSNHVLDGIDLELKRGEFFTLLGSSGCGKTTLLRILAGLEQPNEGQVVLNGEDITNVPPNKRNVNTVFQNYALFPYMNVYNNIAYGLKIQKVSKNEIRERVTEMLNIIQLPGFENRMPNQLSGGQKQRIATARALINKPEILLLDEPLGALDLKLRKQMQINLKELQQKLGITFVYVTHDQEEALNMSDRIGVMNNGVFEQIGTPAEIYNKPKTRFVADFIGDTNLLDAKVLGKQQDKLYQLALGKDTIDALSERELDTNDAVSISVRPEKIQFGYDNSARPEDVPFLLSGVIKNNYFVGATVRTTIRLDSGLEIFASNSQNEGNLPETGRRVWVSWRVRDAVVVIGNRTTAELDQQEEEVPAKKKGTQIQKSRRREKCA